MGNLGGGMGGGMGGNPMDFIKMFETLSPEDQEAFLDEEEKRYTQVMGGTEVDKQLDNLMDEKIQSG
jgi:hypothetical protein